MFKFYIDKNAIEELLAILKKNNLSQIEVKNGNKSIKIAKENFNIQSLNTHPVEDKNVNKKNIVLEEKKTKSLENTVKAPMLGTLYHSPSPKSQPFIKEGMKIKVGDTLFIIEAMKTMNQVKSDREGTVKKILVENGIPVEFDQDLVIIE